MNVYDLIRRIPDEHRLDENVIVTPRYSEMSEHTAEQALVLRKLGWSRDRQGMPRPCGIYMFTHLDDEVIYVGIATANLVARMSTHIFGPAETRYSYDSNTGDHETGTRIPGPHERDYRSYPGARFYFGSSQWHEQDPCMALGDFRVYAVYFKPEVPRDTYEEVERCLIRTARPPRNVAHN